MTLYDECVNCILVQSNVVLRLINISVQELISYSGEPNKHRVGEVISNKSFGFLEVEKDAEKLNVSLQYRGNNSNLYQEFELF